MGLAQPRPAALDETPASRWETIAIKTLIIASVGFWLGGIILIINQRMHPTLSNQALVLAGFWDLAFACLGTGLAPHYVGADDRTTRLWRAVSKLPATDRADLAAASHRRPFAARPWVWRTTSYFAVVCWAFALAFTFQVETGFVRPTLIRLALTLVFLLAGGVQGSISALTGLDRSRHERTYELALYSPAAGEPLASPDFNAIADAAIDELREGTGEIPRYTPLTLLHGNGERGDSRATGA